MNGLNKRDFMIEKQIAQHSANPLPFSETQLINSFLNSIISAKYEKGEEFQPIVKSLYPLLFL